MTGKREEKYNEIKTPFGLFKPLLRRQEYRKGDFYHLLIIKEKNLFFLRKTELHHPCT